MRLIQIQAPKLNLQTTLGLEHSDDVNGRFQSYEQTRPYGWPSYRQANIADRDACFG